MSKLKTKDLTMKGSWKEVVSDCRATVSKPPLDKEPSTEFKMSILLAEHSPIRDIRFRWRWESMKSWVATHFARHHWSSFVSTQRTDRTGIERDKLPQDSPVTFVGEANVQSLIDTMRKRLCFQASSETREYAEDLKLAIMEIEPEIGSVLVPNCIYRGGCPELNTCKHFKYLHCLNSNVGSANIRERYEAYNEIFHEIANAAEE